MKITVAGVGYVGLSLAVLLAQNHEVTAITTTEAKAEKLNRFISPELLRESKLFMIICIRAASLSSLRMIRRNRGLAFTLVHRYNVCSTDEGEGS